MTPAYALAAHNGATSLWLRPDRRDPHGFDFIACVYRTLSEGEAITIHGKPYCVTWAEQPPAKLAASQQRAA